MNVKSVFDHSFRKYGQVLEGYDFTELFQALSGFEVPEEGISYIASVPELEKCEVYNQIYAEGFGGMPIQIGMCSGKNERLNCLEYHKSSEFNIAKDDIVLMLGLQYEIENGKYDTSKVELFYVPAGTGVELYGTTLHYAPCGYTGNKFQVVCVLPRGTNVGTPEITDTVTSEARWCMGTNKWLLVHPDSEEAEEKLYAGLSGENITYRC